MEVLASLLGPADSITLIGFARQPRLLAEALPGDQAAQLSKIVAQTPAEGGTNLEEALKLGTELALRQFTTGAQNRIVLMTDGAANLGDADPARLAGLIANLREKKIAFDACGVGALFQPAQFFHSYLIGYIFVFGLGGGDLVAVGGTQVDARLFKANWLVAVVGDDDADGHEA